MAKELYKDNFVPTPIPTTPTPEPTPTRPPVIITPRPTPTPDPGEVFIKSGGLNMSQWFSFSRGTFRDTIRIKTTVYRYQIRDYYTLDVPDQDLKPVRPKGGNKFLFLWIHTVSDSTTPLGGYGPECYTVEYHGQVYRGTIEPSFIYELATYADLYRKEKSTPYGYFYGRDYELEKGNHSVKNRRFIPMPRMVSGESNSWDGYVIYQIPKGATTADLTVHGDFDNMYHTRWRFLEADVFSFETVRR